jgi:quercetin dioxygenase-like cupin family protein
MSNSLPGLYAKLSRGLMLCLALLVAGGGVVVAPTNGRGHGEVEERRVLDNERVVVVEYVFPPGFRGDEHVAPVDEFAYVLDGEFAVITKGQGRQRVRAGEIEWAPKGTVHYSVNDSKKPARVLVVLLKER